MARKMLVTGWDQLILSLLRAAGVEPTMCRRVVLDLEVGKPGKLYVENYLSADDLEGIEIHPDLIAGMVVERG